jgi:hypothetical protein
MRGLDTVSRCSVFLSQHYDVTLAYVGHATARDDIRTTGSLPDRDATVVYRRGRKVLPR